MSVFIEDFCKDAESEFSKQLKELLDEVVLIGSDELEFIDVKGEMIAKIYVAHTISCNDIEVLQRVLADSYWRFTYAIGRAGYELWIDIPKESL